MRPCAEAHSMYRLPVTEPSDGLVFHGIGIIEGGEENGVEISR